MSTEELQSLVGDFRRTLAELARKGCVTTLDASCAPTIDLASDDELHGELLSDDGNLLVAFGRADAPLMFVGEAMGGAACFEPTPHELLAKMIGVMGWSVDTVCIAMLSESITPERSGAQLLEEIHSMAPKVIVTLGERATNLVLRRTASLGSVRGSWHEDRSSVIMATFDPRALLLEPAKKREAWSDLQEVMKRLESLGIAPSA